MLEELGNDLLKLAFAGVGAVAIVAEKACDVGKVLVKKGEATVEQGKQINEEFQQKCREATKERKEQRFSNDVEALSTFEREALRRKLSELDELEREAEAAAKEQQSASDDDSE